MNGYTPSPDDLDEVATPRADDIADRIADPFLDRLLHGTGVPGPDLSGVLGRSPLLVSVSTAYAIDEFRRDLVVGRMLARLEERPTLFRWVTTI